MANFGNNINFNNNFFVINKVKMATQCKDVVLPTPLDFINAIMYTSDRIKKEKCQDVDIVKKIPGIKWQKREENRIYHCPEKLKDTCEHGKCVISNKETCMSQSQVPFSVSGKIFPERSCTDDKECVVKENIDPKYAPFPGSTFVCSEKKCIPAKTYLEWREGKDGQDGKCIMGNDYLRKWCEFPESRSDQSEKGTTDCPPFKYDENTGDCKITKEYCKWMGVSYKDNNGSPDCYEKTGQTIGEFIMGKTIFRWFKKSTETFDLLPNEMNKIADRKNAQHYVELSKDFGGPGINLYQIIWKPETEGKHPTANGHSIAGFFADEVEKVYPNLVKSKLGAKYIYISRDQVKENPKIKRIYLVVGSGKWLLESIMAMMPKQN